MTATAGKTVVIETAKLEGHALDWATMRAAGYILVRVGYEGGEYESPEQATLPKWFKFQTDNAVGAYWMKEKGEKWEYAYWPPYTGIYQPPASPSTNAAQLAWDLVDAHIKRMGDCAEPVNGWDVIPEGKQCFAMAHNNEFATGATKRIAVCRAVVLAKLGTSVEVPAVLVAQ